MASKSVSELIFQAAAAGSVNLLRKIIHESHALSIALSDLAIYNEHGETPLQVACKGDHYDFVEFFVQRVKTHISIVEGFNAALKEIVDYKEVQPSTEMANILGLSNGVPIARVMDYLIDLLKDNSSWWIFLYSCLMASSMARQDRITALEIMGVAFIVKKELLVENYKVGSYRGMRCWKRATELRNSTADGDEAITKVPCEISLAACRPNAFSVEYAVEFVTLDELNQLDEKQTALKTLMDHWNIQCEPIMVQALLVSQRIFSSDPVNARRDEDPCLFHLSALLNFGYFCHQSFKQSNLALDSLLLLIEEARDCNKSISSQKCDIFVETLTLLSNCFQREREQQQQLARPIFILKAIQFSVFVAGRLPTVTDQHKKKHRVLSEMLYDFVMLLFPNFPTTQSVTINQLEQCLAQLSRLNINGVSSILHVIFERYHLISKDVIPIIQLLFKAGMNSNVIDEYGRTPLHILARSWKFRVNPAETTEWRLAIFQIMLDAGHHLDQAANNGETVRSILIKKRMDPSFCIDPFHPYLEVVINMVFPLTLSDLCARAIRHHQIPIKGNLPSSLQSFVNQQIANSVVITLP